MAFGAAGCGIVYGIITFAGNVLNTGKKVNEIVHNPLFANLHGTVSSPSFTRSRFLVIQLFL